MIDISNREPCDNRGGACTACRHGGLVALLGGAADKQGRAPFTMFWRRADGTLRAQEFRGFIEDWEAKHIVRRAKSEEDAMKMLGYKAGEGVKNR